MPALNTTVDTYRMSISRGISPTSTWDDILPIHVSMIGPLSQEWTLVRPLPITLEFGDDCLIISDDTFCMYGVGNTIASAARDFKNVLIDYYGVLSSQGDSESVRLFRYLQTYIQPTPRK